ncbi:MAG: type II toxin-antitoxin system PemK/MazF family toxin [Syntrophorhabdaceae bacterium]|nr:type II toxin-antitoxin system PemK/MazF family toxin [Syntrophorhabdaceae bacterium]MDD5244975.1 type II toxin-antitoxin system PemK/MazF family toxin [Syntrophorhabdaceae bacterium]
MKQYIPEKGDFIAVTFDPQSGHEQKGRRPALVVSNTLFNQRTGLAIVCPITNTDRAYPFHVAITDNPDVRGFVMTEQVKSIDFHARKAKLIGRASGDILDEVLSILDACIY